MSLLGRVESFLGVGGGAPAAQGGQEVGRLIPAAPMSRMPASNLQPIAPMQKLPEPAVSGGMAPQAAIDVSGGQVQGSQPTIQVGANPYHQPSYIQGFVDGHAHGLQSGGNIRIQ